MICLMQTLAGVDVFLPCVPYVSCQRFVYLSRQMIQLLHAVAQQGMQFVSK